MGIVFLADKEALLVGLLIKFQLIKFDSLLFTFTLELAEGFKGGLRLPLSLLNFFAVLYNCFSELFTYHTLDDVLAEFLARRPVSEEVVLRLLSVENFNFDLLEGV